MASSTQGRTGGGGIIRTTLKWVFRGTLLVLLIVVLALLFLFRGALYNRFVAFPKQETAWKTIRQNRIPVPFLTGWKEYKGAIHNHSEISHDSEVPFEHILKTMKDTGRDFIIMSDHCQEGDNNLYGLQWKGLHEGVLFIQGFEMQAGFMPVGLPEGTVLSCEEDPEILAGKIEEAGGTVFIIHAEQKRPWHLSQISAMEIYNIHPDFMEELKGKRLLRLVTNVLVNLRTYPDHCFRLSFDPPVKVLNTWDDLNISRDIGGFGGNDTHQNVGVYGIYQADGSLRLRHAEGKDIKTYPLNFLTRGLLRLFCGPLEPGKEAFRLQIDPYERMTRHVCTHVLANDLTEEEILGAIMDGRAFVGFDMIADSSGFVWMAKGPSGQAVMGESIPLSPGLKLVGAAPHVCRFIVKRHGQEVYRSEGASMEFVPDQPGKYRVEAELRILDEWVPWVYANPVEITAAGG
ncbi:MAG TPA: hypothetical protein PLI98_10605 [Candidatus Hydrogenedentes bacterium]|nr:hypothetical protein [Candidatus Hydrogenedentota bacterium]